MPECRIDTFVTMNNQFGDLNQSLMDGKVYLGNRAGLGCNASYYINAKRMHFVSYVCFKTVL